MLQYLQDFRSHLSTEWRDYAKTIAALSALNSLVYTISGRRIAILLAASSLVALPLLKKQICILYKNDLNAKRPAYLAMLSVGMCFINPFAAASLMTGVAIAIFQHDSQTSSIIPKTNQLHGSTGLDDATLKQTCREIQTQLAKFETALKTLLGIKDIADPTVAGPCAIPLNDLNSTTQRDLDIIKSRLQILEGLCQNILSTPDLVQMMTIAGQVNQDLSRMNVEYSGRKRELELINQDLRNSRQRLDQVVETLAGLEDRQRAQLQELSRTLAALSAHIPLQRGG